MVFLRRRSRQSRRRHRPGTTPVPFTSALTLALLVVAFSASISYGAAVGVDLRDGGIAVGIAFEQRDGGVRCRIDGQRTGHADVAGTRSLFASADESLFSPLTPVALIVSPCVDTSASSATTAVVVAAPTLSATAAPTPTLVLFALSTWLPSVWRCCRSGWHCSPPLARRHCW